MRELYILLFSVTTCIAFNCEQYQQSGCTGCVSNYDGLSNYCVWCGSTDNSSISKGLCLDSNNPQADVTTCKPNSNNPCCQAITYGSNTELTCAGDFDGFIKNKVLAYVAFMFFTTPVVSAFCYAAYKHYFYKRNPVISFFIGTFMPFFCWWFDDNKFYKK